MLTHVEFFFFFFGSAHCLVLFVGFSVTALQRRLGDRSGKRHAEERRQDG